MARTQAAPAAGLRLHALAQRCRQHACRDLPARHHRRLAARGGGAFYHNLDKLERDAGEGLDVIDPKTRILDQSRIGPILCGDKDALGGGPPVTAMLIQNANSASRARQRKVARGLAREDLFTCVHEQFMTATARWPTSCCPRHVPGIRRHLLRPGPHPSRGRPVLEPLRGLPHQPRGGLRAGPGGWGRTIRASASAPSNCSTQRCAPRAWHVGRGGGAGAGSIATKASRPRISSMAFHRKTAASISNPTGRRSVRIMLACGRCPTISRTMSGRARRCRSAWSCRRRAPS